MRVRVQYNTDGEKKCTKCNNFKDVSNFHKWSKGQDGLKLFCKPCVREYDLKLNEPKRIFPKKERDGLLHCRHCEQYLDRSNFWGGDLSYCRPCKKIVGINSNLRKKGLDMESYSILEKSQNGVCAICKNSEKYNKRLSVDHDHSCCPGTKTCGKCTRGLLCSICNKTLGMAKDDIKILQSMINYLQK
jgi:hypothetical protein